MNESGKSARYAALDEIIEAMKQGELESMQPKAVAVEVEAPAEAMPMDAMPREPESGESLDDMAPMGEESVDPQKRAALEAALREFLK